MARSWVHFVLLFVYLSFELIKYGKQSAESEYGARSPIRLFEFTFNHIQI